MTTLVKTPTQQQQYGANPTAVRDTDQYKAEYIKNFVERWDQLIDWEARAASEGSFFIELLRAHGVKRVLDVASGTGFHSVRLLKAGFDVVSADGSAEMLGKAFENGMSHGHVLRTVHADWRWLTRDIHEKFDAIICLGNSFTHLFDEQDRRKALAEFYAVLRHDGILILDQRNYDQILDGGYASKHVYYYCGEDVQVYPEHVDPGLARFRYGFPDGSLFHLNMFPLRKSYTRTLMKEVGFTDVMTFADFQETHHQPNPDFFIHVAAKVPNVEDCQEFAEKMGFADQLAAGENSYSAVVSTAREYYNSDAADSFYAHVWGGEDIHIGIYQSDEERIFDASQRTVAEIASDLGLASRHKVLDIGAGYGGSARYLVKRYGCRVDCLNLSEVQNQRNRSSNRQQGLNDRIAVIDGSFEAIPGSDEQYDVVWSQDAILHSGNRALVIQEVARVLKPGGLFVFTDPMQANDCPEGVLQPVLDRIHLDTLGSPGFYQEASEAHGLVLESERLMTAQLVNHYSRVLQEVQRRYRELTAVCGEEYLERMQKGLRHWIEAGQQGYLAWGIMRFRKVR